MTENITFEEYYEEDVKAVLELSDEIYNKLFHESFKDIRILYKSINSKIKPVTDSELEWILCDLPIKLFDISESLNRLKLEIEVIKLKKNEYKINKNFEYQNLRKLGEKITKSDISDNVEVFITEHEILLSVYKSVANRVEQELSFSRELIMGAKKIWDSRRISEKSNPVGEVVNEEDRYNELPEYR